MDNPIIQNLAPGALASAMLAFVLREWDTLYDLGVKVYDRFTRDRVDASLEVLEYESLLDLKDESGNKAVFTRRLKVRYLQDRVIAFQDQVWGDGDVLEDYNISPGQIVDKYKDGDRWNILISLRRTRNRGESEEFRTQRSVRDGFTSSEEWIQVETWLPTKHISLSIVFPKDRPCKQIWLTEKSRNRTTRLTLDNLRQLPDGRTEIEWSRQKPRRGEVFTLKWEW